LSSEPGLAPGAESAPASPAPGGRLGATIARNAMFSVGGRLTFLFAWALITPFMLHVLGENRFAIWALFFALSGYFATFDLGLSQALVKYVAQFSTAGDARALRGVVTLGALAFVTLAAPVVVVLATFQGPILDAIHTPAPLRAEAGWTLIAIAVVLGLNNLVGVITAVLIGKQRLDVTNRIQLIVTAIQIAGTLAALELGGGLRGLVVAYGGGVLVNGFLSLRAMRAIEPEARLDPSAINRRLLRELFHFGSALQITNVGAFLQFQLDKFLLAHLATLGMVTRFELSSRVAQAAWTLPTWCLTPLVPAVSQLGSLADHDRILRLYGRASRYIAAIAFPLAAFMIVTAPALVTGWLGPGYPEAARGTIGMISFLLLTVLTGVGTSVCRGKGVPWMEVEYTVVGTIVHLALSLWLVPRLAFDGALLALFASGVVSVSFFLWRLHRWIHEPFGRWLRDVIAVPFAVSLTAALLVVLWRGGLMRFPAGRAAAWMDVARSAAVFVTVTGAGYVATRFVTKKELRELMGALPGR